MVKRWSYLTMVSVLLGAVVLAGCAKRPATTAATSPAPTGATGRSEVSRSTGAAEPGVTGPGVTAAPGSRSESGTAIPRPARPAVRDFAAISDLVDIHFDFDKSDIRPGDAKILDSDARWLRSNPDHLVLIEGHCDERGTNEYNLALGDRRAKSTANYLVSQGVAVDRITVISYGEERPLCTEHNEACWSKNRRAHFLGKPR